MPEIGFDDEPISPVIRELTVTNRKPNRQDHGSADGPARGIRGDQVRSGHRANKRQRAEHDERKRHVVLRTAFAGRAALACERPASRPPASRRSSGKARHMLMMPPAATAPAPM